MTPLVEVRLEGLARRLEERRGILEKRDAHVMRTGRHGHTNLEVFVEKRIVAIGGLLDRQRPDGRPVEQQRAARAIPGPLKPLDAPRNRSRASQIWMSHFAIVRERVRRRHPAARADREPGHMILLREIGRQPDDVGLQGRLRAADRQPADLLRGRDVSVQQRRGQVADRDVVEAVTAVIGGQERRWRRCRGTAGL